MQEQSEDAANVRCPGCEGQRLRWRVKRASQARQGGCRHSLEWTCGDCGERWDDPPQNGLQSPADADALRPHPRAAW